MRQDELLQAIVAGKPNEVSDPLLFAKLVQVWTGKGRIPPEPKLFEPRPVAVNQMRDKVQGFQPPTSCVDGVLKAREYGLAGPTFMLFTQGQSERLISTLREAVIAILIACRYLIDPLAQKLKQRKIRMSRRSWIINQRLYTAKDT